MLPSFTFRAKEMVTVGIYKGSQLKNPDLRGDCPNSTLWHFLGLNFFYRCSLKKKHYNSCCVLVLDLFLLIRGP